MKDINTIVTQWNNLPDKSSLQQVRIASDEFDTLIKSYVSAQEQLREIVPVAIDTVFDSYNDNVELLARVLNKYNYVDKSSEGYTIPDKYKGYSLSNIDIKPFVDLQQENEQLKHTYQSTIHHLYEIGNDELARYFEAQISGAGWVTMSDHDE